MNLLYIYAGQERTCLSPEDAAVMVVYDNCTNEDEDFYAAEARLCATYGDLVSLFSGLKVGECVSVGAVNISLLP